MPDERTPRDDAVDLIERQRREITRLRDELARADQRRREVERERDRLQRQNDRLKQQLDAARRAGFRQAAPFAKSRAQGRGGRPGRRAGAAYGRRARRAAPSRIDERYVAALPAACPDCGGVIHPTGVTAQYQEALPIVRPIVRQFDVQVGCCGQCGRRVQGRHPLQTSDALGAANVHLGPGAVALRRADAHALRGPAGEDRHGAARAVRIAGDGWRLGPATPPHRDPRDAELHGALCAGEGSPVVSPDETGWRVGGVLHWLWVFVTPDTTVYAIRPGRSFDAAATVLGPAFDGVLIRDGWAPYRRFTAALHQTCVTHLLRRARTLGVDHPRSPWAPAVERVLLDGLALRDRRDAHAISAHGLAVARGHLLARLADLINTAPALPAAQRFAAHLATEFPAVFAFLYEPGIDATNWRAEQAIRPAVVTRKVCGGNRTPRGAETQEVLTSVVRTIRQRDLDLTSVLTTILRTPEPIVPIALQSVSR